MLPNSSENEKLFTKRVPVSFKDVYTNNTRTSQLCLTIEWQDASISPYNKKVLVISLTDDNDPFFLYNLHLSEEDFQTLKSSHGLLVNFASFPQHIIDFVDLCLREERNPQPKFLLIFTISDKPGSVTSESQLDIVETTQFRHLTHLSLRFVAATDSSIRIYLAACFKKLKEERLGLQNQLAFLEENFTAQLANCKQTLAGKCQEVELLQQERDMELKRRESKHAIELKEEKRKFLSRFKEEEERFERELKEKDKLMGQIQHLESSVNCLHTRNKELEGKNSKHESTIREIRCHLLSSNDEIKKLKETNKKKCDSLYSELKDKQSQVRHKDEQINGLQQELRRLKEKIDVDIKQRKTLEKELEKVKLHLEMSEKSLKMLEDERNKSYNIIHKLQHKIETELEKAKSKSDLSEKQEQKIKEQDNLLNKLRTENEAKKIEAKSWKDSVNCLQNRVKELEKDLGRKETVISYLRWELTEKCTFLSYTPSANLGPSPSDITKNQLQQQKSSGSEHTPLRPVSAAAPKPLRNTATPGMKNDSIPSRFQRTDRTDSAYYTSPYLTQDTPINPVVNNADFDPENIDIDPKAVSAAFGDGAQIPTHSTAKKQPNPTKSTIPKVSKKR